MENRRFIYYLDSMTIIYLLLLLAFVFSIYGLVSDQTTIVVLGGVFFIVGGGGLIYISCFGAAKLLEKDNTLGVYVLNELDQTGRSKSGGSDRIRTSAGTFTVRNGVNYYVPADGRPRAYNPINNFLIDKIID